MARNFASLPVCVLLQPHGNRFIPASECIVIIAPRVVAGAAVLSPVPRWSANSSRNRASIAVVSGSLLALAPGYCWPHVLVSTPVVCQCVEVLRFRSTPSWLLAVGGFAQPLPCSF